MKVKEIYFINLFEEIVIYMCIYIYMKFIFKLFLNGCYLSSAIKALLSEGIIYCEEMKIVTCINT
jgi:hypothetical protein